MSDILPVAYITQATHESLSTRTNFILNPNARKFKSVVVSVPGFEPRAIRHTIHLIACCRSTTVTELFENPKFPFYFKICLIQRVKCFRNIEN